MYYLQLGVSIIFVIGFVISLIYQFSLSVRVATKQLAPSVGMQKIFTVSFCTWMFMFIVVTIWQENITWSVTKVLMALTLYSLVAFVLAGISALGLWRWRR